MTNSEKIDVHRMLARNRSQQVKAKMLADTPIQNADDAEFVRRVIQQLENDGTKFYRQKAKARREKARRHAQTFDLFDNSETGD